MKSSRCISVILVSIMILSSCSNGQPEAISSSSSAAQISSDEPSQATEASAEVLTEETESATELIVDLPKIAIEPFNIEDSGEPLFPAFDSATELEGYINNKGEWVIEPMFAGADDFENGVATVYIVGEEGALINRRGEVLYTFKGRDDPQLKMMGENRISVTIWIYSGIIDLEGNWIVEPIYEHLGVFKEGLAVAKTGGRPYGFINPKGEWAIPPKFDSYSFETYPNKGGFSDGLAAVKLNEQWGYIDHNGDWTIEPQYDFAQDFCEGYAAVETDRKWGLIDKTGAWVIEPSFARIALSSYGVKRGVISAQVECLKDDLYPQTGLIDLKGNWIKEPIFISGDLVFSDDGVAYAGVDTKDHHKVITGGAIDIDGNWVIEPKYFGFVKFRNGLARVGKVIEIPTGIDAPMENFSFRHGYIDLKDNWIYSYEEYN